LPLTRGNGFADKHPAIDCHTSELTKDDLKPLSEDIKDDDVAIQTAVNTKAPAGIMNLQGVLLDGIVACDNVKCKFKCNVYTPPKPNA
jgi:cytochrome c peroxidase